MSSGSAPQKRGRTLSPSEQMYLQSSYEAWELTGLVSSIYWHPNSLSFVKIFSRDSHEKVRRREQLGGRGGRLTRAWLQS